MKQSQRPAVPRTVTSRSGRPPSKLALATLIASVLAAVWALAMLTPAGQVLYIYMYFFVEFYIGVVTLVSLSLTVMAGVLATDRTVLMIRHRVLLQSVHRSTGIIAIIGLGLHIVLKVSEGDAGAIDPVLPFVSGRGLYVGLGTIAGYLMVSVLWTGLVRSRFVGVGRPWMWRAMHSAAYVSWPIALLHGLNAGRAPATWVTLSYLGCIFVVVVALLVRLTVALGRKRQEQGQTTATAAMKPVGKVTSDSDADSRGARGGVSRRRASEDIMVGRAPRESFRTGRPDPVVDSWSRPEESAAAYSPRRGSDRFVVPEVAQARSDEDWDMADEPPQRRRATKERESAGPPRGAGRRFDEDVEESTRGAGRRRFDEDVEDLYRRPRRDAESSSARRSAESSTYRADEPVPAAERSGDEQWAGSRRWAADDRASERDLGDDYRENYRDSYRETTRETARRRSSGEGRTAGDAGRLGRHSLDEDDYPARETVDESRDTGRFAAGRSPVLDDDDTPTLVDLSARRAMRAAAAEAASSPKRTSRRKRSSEDAADEDYWRELRGEAR